MIDRRPDRRPYAAFGRVLAQRSSGTTTYLLADHLGSTTAVVNTAGMPISWHAYWPYGGHRAGAALPTDRGYTGQQYEGGISDTNLYYYRARFYSPALAHFASADPTAGDGLNRYAYVGGNPLTRTDSSGYCFSGPAYDVFVLGCNGAQDVLDWWNCALTCGDNWIGELARKGVDDPRSGYWGEAMLSGGTTPGLILLALVETIRANPSPWRALGGYAWDSKGGNLREYMFQFLAP